MKKALVTGGCGFIGSNLVEYLLRYGAKKVRVLDNLSNGHYANIKEFESYENFEFIGKRSLIKKVIIKASNKVMQITV